MELTPRKNPSNLRRYAPLFVAFVAIGFLAAIEVPTLMAKDEAHLVPVNGKVLLGYSNSVPTGLTFEGKNANYSAVVGDISGSCACGGYYFMVNLPDRENYRVVILYTRDNATHVCETTLNVSAGTESLNELIRCP